VPSESSQVSAWRFRPALATATIVFLIGWIVIAVGVRDAGATNGDGIPYWGWWISWAMIAVGAVPVFIGSLKTRTGRWALPGIGTSILVFLVPLVTAAWLMRTTGSCMSNPYGSAGLDSVDRCPADAATEGWIVLGIGFGVLCLAIVVVAIVGYANATGGSTAGRGGPSTDSPAPGGSVYPGDRDAPGPVSTEQ
jgi:hypothetical protein